MISMTLLELVGLAISYGLLKSIAIRDGAIDFRAMFQEKMHILNESFTKPFREGFAANMVEAIKKRAASLDQLDEDTEVPVDEKKELEDRGDTDSQKEVESLPPEFEDVGLKGIDHNTPDNGVVEGPIIHLENHVMSLSTTEETLKNEDHDASLVSPTSTISI